jgi:hypothetical protein
MQVLTEYCEPIVLANAIESAAEDPGDDLYLVRMARRARAVRQNYERGRTDAAVALEELFEEIERSGRRQRCHNKESTAGRPKAGRRQ